MRFTFIHFRSFTREWTRIGLDEEALRAFEKLLMDDAQIGDVIANTGGLRKVRIGLPGAGKRGGARVAYVVFHIYRHIALVTVYAKNDQANLAPAEKKAIRKLISAVEEYVKKQCEP